jgi:hypothetical protein
MQGRRLVGQAAALLLGLTLCGCGSRARHEAASAPVLGKSAQAAAPAEAPATTRPESAAADSHAAPRPEKAATPGPVLTITPEQATITADDTGLQLRVSRQFPDGTASDLSRAVAWRVEPSAAAAIDRGGYLRPLQGGELTVTATIDGAEVKAHVNVGLRAGRSWDFAQDVVPVLTRLGCNTGSCHGKADGQNGFHLSLSGYDPEGDYQAMVRDAGQRRVAPIAPERSLVLEKATGRAPHGGGPRLAVGSPEYRLLLDWLAAGAPRQRGKTHGAVVSLNVEPRTLRLREPGPGQLRVVARFSDGHERDVTRQAIFKTNDEAAATIDSQGRTSLRTRGEADLVVRYQSRVQSVRLSAVVNPDLKFDFAALPRRNLIDRELFKRLEALRVPPSPPATDAAFLRRISLDLTGEQPAPAQIRAFLADKDPAKRARLVDQLLERQEFVLFWRIKLGDLLQISTARQGNSAYRYQQWIDRCLTENTPWDVVVTKLLTALGDPNDQENGGPVNYALDAPEATVQAEQTAQRFLGLRMRCAQCHDHPFDVWTQDDYFGLAAFFAKVQRSAMAPGAMAGRAVVSVNPEGQVLHLRTKKAAEPRLLGGKAVTLAAKDDPRKALASWMTAPDNPYFARAIVNWTWAQLFGKGLVDPPDDMSQANPAVHPELLDALQRHFVATKYDLRGLIRTIASSESYALSAGTVPGNERDSRLFSHHLPRPLTAHQMADALAQATDVPNAFGSLGNRLSIRVTDPSVPSAILDTFGRCSRAAGCAPVQTPPLSLKQALLLIGGDVIESKVTSLNGYLSSALKLELEPDELVENLYLRTVCRPPTPEESSRWSAELKQASSYREAAEDLFWSLLNSREFAFNH